jgi:SAM-dependent methyltransferase
MDAFIERFPYVHDDDLALCEAHGVAYQRDMARRIRYGDYYLAKFDGYDPAIEAAVNAGRCAMLAGHLEVGATVLDIGAGSGAFVAAARAAGFAAVGYDVIPGAVARLRARGLYSPANPVGFDAVALWDTIEHLEDPGATLQAVRVGTFLFVSIPVFDSLREIRKSKHYRPGEHLYYWTEAGFAAWVERHGYELMGVSDHETAAGRQGIGAFAFRRSRQICNMGGTPSPTTY